SHPHLGVLRLQSGRLLQTLLRLGQPIVLKREKTVVEFLIEGSWLRRYQHRSSEDHRHQPVHHSYSIASRHHKKSPRHEDGGLCRTTTREQSKLELETHRELDVPFGALLRSRDLAEVPFTRNRDPGAA